MDLFVKTNGIRIHAHDHGGDGPTLVLIPGLTANARCFDGVAAALGGSLRLVAPDMRGRGLSDKPEGSYSIVEHAADVLGLLDALGIERAWLGGHSFGGMLTMAIAARHPERVERAILLDATLSATRPEVRDAIRPSLARLEQRYPSFDDYLAQIRAAPYYHGFEWDPVVESYYRADVSAAEDESVRPRSRPDQIAAVIDGVVEEQWPAIVPAVRCPTLLVRATGGYGPPGAPPLISAAQAEETLALLADRRYVEVPGNHQTMLYGAGARGIAAAIREFLGR